MTTALLHPSGIDVSKIVPIDHVTSHQFEPLPTIGGKEIKTSDGPLHAPIPIFYKPSVIHIFVASKTEGRYACGHCASDEYIVMVYGSRTEILSYKRFPLCPSCALVFFAAHSITCCRCGMAIWPGMPVVLYDKRSVAPKHFDFTPVGKRSVIGCLRYGCCPSSMYFAGRWVVENGISRFKRFEPS